MADLRLETQLEAHVDRFGNAARTRRWRFSDISGRGLDLSGFFMEFDTTSPNVYLECCRDSEGREIHATTAPVAGGGICIKCSFGTVLPPKASYSVEVGYRHNRYFRYLSKTGVWFLSEWFARSGPLDDPGCSQEEPQRLRFELTIDDPRGKLLGRVLKTFEWDADPPPDTFDKQSTALQLCWERNLRPDDKTEDIIVAYRVGWIIDKLGPLIRWFLPFLPKPG